ncbi:MAG: hypothetical protein GQ579_02740 [Bacteroidales bacterium]|nr:hypothetical protein [Bacteroidales bacterium]
MTVHLVNLTNPMMMKGPYRELLPLGEQIVKIQIPPGKTVADVHLLVSGIAPEYNVIDGVVELVVSEILDHEVIALDLDNKQKR